MTRPRILLITERFAPDIGGVARSSTRTAAALARLREGRRVDVDVLAWTRTLPPGALESGALESGALESDALEPGAAGVTLHRLGLFSSWDLSLQHTLNVLESLHGERGYAAVWGHYLFPAGFLAVLFAELTGLPATVSARGNDVDQMMFPPGDFARLTWTLERARVISSVSRDLAKKIDVLLGRDAGVETVPNAVDLDVFQPGPGDPALRRALGIGEDEAVLGFSGELRHKKGFPFLLSALSHVRAARPACLLVVGEVRAREQNHLMAYQANAPADAARIVVTGHLDDAAEVARHLRLCDVMLMPSVWDGLPNALLEAMACGVLVLASDAGGMPEVITHGRDGFLVPRAQLGRLGEAALELLALPRDSDDRRAIVEAARARVRERFHADVEAAALARVLDRLLDHLPARLTPRADS